MAEKAIAGKFVMQSQMHSPMQTRVHAYVPSSRGVAIEDDVKCWAEESFQLYATEEDGERQDKSTVGEQQQQQHKSTKFLKGNNIRYAIASVIGVEPRQVCLKHHFIQQLSLIFESLSD